MSARWRNATPQTTVVITALGYIYNQLLLRCNFKCNEYTNTLIYANSTQLKTNKSSIFMIRKNIILCNLGSMNTNVKWNGLLLIRLYGGCMCGCIIYWFNGKCVYGALIFAIKLCCQVIKPIHRKYKYKIHCNA